MHKAEHQEEQDYSLKNYFVPLTNTKAIFFIAILGFLVFGNALFNDFVWDDRSFIVNNLDLRNFDISRSFGHSVFNSSGYYRPIPALYFTFLYSFFKEVPFFYHFIQITLHIISTILLFFVFKHFFKLPISLLLSFIFLIHPIQAESVVYISASSANQLLFIFGLTALLISMKEAMNHKKKALIFSLLLLSLLTKESGFLFLLIVLLYQLIFKKKRFLTFFSLGIITTFIYFFIRFFIGREYFIHIDFAPIGRLTLLERLINIPEIIFYYIKTLFFPINLAINQMWVVTKITIQDFYIPLLIDSIFFIFLLSISIYIYQKRKKYFKAWIFFILWFCAGLFMILQIFPLDMTVADRWFYFPLAGLLGILGIILQQLKFQKKWIKMTSVLLAVVIILILSIRTMIRNNNWSNSITLYSNDIQIEDNFDNRSNYAAALRYEGKFDLALEQMKKSVEQYPYEANIRGLGVIYLRLGQPEKAKDYLYKALEGKSFANQNSHHHDLDTYYILATYLLYYGDAEEAKRIANAGIKDYPDAQTLWVLLALSNYKLKSQQKALTAAEKAYALGANKQIANLRMLILNKQPIPITNPTSSSGSAKVELKPY